MNIFLNLAKWEKLLPQNHIWDKSPAFWLMSSAVYSWLLYLSTIDFRLVNRGKYHCHHYLQDVSEDLMKKINDTPIQQMADSRHSENRSCDYHFIWNMMGPVFFKEQALLCNQECFILCYIYFPLSSLPYWVRCLKSLFSALLLYEN